MKVFNRFLKYIVCFLCTVFLSYGDSNVEDNSKVDKAIPKKYLVIKVKKAPKIIHVYLFDDFPDDLGRQMVVKLQKIYPTVHFEGKIPLPKSAYYKARNRYLAVNLLSTMMSLQPNNDMVLGMTSKDISLKYKGYENWGVMGLSYLNKRAAVISSYRLRMPAKQIEHCQKLMFHEMGHVEGLPHCKKYKHCIMRDAEGKNRFSELNDFCPSCKAYLKNKGYLIGCLQPKQHNV